MSDPVTRLNAALEGRYHVEHGIGEGGMATVYLADDVRHERKVALKVLKPELAAVLGAERFLAEIKTTANLQHPHILPLHDSGEADGFLFYVMPYVEGDTLRDRLDRDKQLPIDEAVQIATGVANALQAAHEAGIVHRDIKPGNILLSRGEPLVSDFGIAIAVGSAGGDRLTETGLSVGTPYYMSPEQATGDQGVGAQSDIYSLAAVLCEMLTGDPPYLGSTAQAVLGQIIAGEAPSVTDKRASVPIHVDATIRKALERLPADRFTSATEFAAALGDPSFAHGETPATAVGPSNGLWKMASGALALGLTAALLVPALRPEPAAPVLKTVLDPVTAEIGLPWGSLAAISPDGSRMIVPIRNETGDLQLGLKTRSILDVTPLPGTEGARNPVFSPDGRSIVYAVGTDLVKRPVVGGTTITLATDVEPARVALDWLEDGTILYEQAVPVEEGFRRIVEISENGGEVIRHVFASTDEVVAPVWVQGLPGGRGALVVACTGSQTACTTDRADLFLVDADGERNEVIASQVSRAWYVPTGHVVYATAGGAIVAQEMDVGALEVSPTVIPLFDGVRISLGTADMVLGDDGTVLYVTGTGLATDGFELAWVDREGNEEAVDPGENPRRFAGVALSPGDQFIATAILGDRSRDVWVKELPNGPLQRLTDVGTAGEPTWIGSGDSVAYVEFGPGSLVRRQPRDGRGSVGDSVLMLAEGYVADIEFAADGAWAAFADRDADRTGQELRLGRANLVSGEVEQAVLGHDAYQMNIDLSPDGRYIAYSSGPGDQRRVFVRPFPELESALVQVSTATGHTPVWSRGTNELFYLVSGTGTRTLTAAEYATEGGFRVLSRTPLFETGAYDLAATWEPYDVSADGQRFLFVRRPRAGALEREERLILVQNWFVELEELIESN